MPSTTLPAPNPQALEQLKSNNVPIESLLDACRACKHDECESDDEDEVESYPKGFDVDMDSEMLNLQAYGRQIVISTGKSNWAREVTEGGTTTGEQIAKSVKQAYDESLATKEEEKKKSVPSFLGRLAKKFSSTTISDDVSELAPGIHPSSAVDPTSDSTSVATSDRLSILTSSFVSHSHSHDHESIMVFPDYKVVHEVAQSSEAAAEMVERYLRRERGRTGQLRRELEDVEENENEGEKQDVVEEKDVVNEERGTLRSWPLPYRAVILLCSHKTRDKRCHIAAPLLAHQFHHHLSKHDIVVDEAGEDLEEGAPIEDWPLSIDAADRQKRFKDVAEGGTDGGDGGRVGVFRVSHIGGHKFSGNVIVYFPNGTCIWYGRVTPVDVGVIVDRTILHGKVIPEFLRGGLGLDGKNGAKGILEW